MAVKKTLEVVPALPAQSNEELSDRLTHSIETGETLTLEQIVADELLDSIDWKAVKAALVKGVRRKLISWFISDRSASMIATNEIEAEAIAIQAREAA